MPSHFEIPQGQGGGGSSFNGGTVTNTTTFLAAVTVHEPFVVQDATDAAAFEVIDDPDNPGSTLIRASGGGLRVSFDPSFGVTLATDAPGAARVALLGESVLFVSSADAIEAQLDPLGGLALGAFGSEDAVYGPAGWTVGQSGAIQATFDLSNWLLFKAANGTILTELTAGDGVTSFGRLKFTDASHAPVIDISPGNGDITVYDQPTGHSVAQFYNEGDEGVLQLNAGDKRRGYWDADGIIVADASEVTQQFIGSATIGFFAATPVGQAAYQAVPTALSLRTVLIDLGFMAAS